jgi:hypothetical protein
MLGVFRHELTFAAERLHETLLFAMVIHMLVVIRNALGTHTPFDLGIFAD